MKAHVLTLFTDMFPGPLGDGVIGRALDDGTWSLETTDIRDFATDNYGSVDDTPYGGGAGMVLKPDVLSTAIDSIQAPGRILYMSPRGRIFDQQMAKELAHEENLTLICGRYEGIDQRILDAYDIEEVSIGDYILAGGEVAAHVILESTVRLLPNVLGNDETLETESFDDNLLEYPHYTRPAKWLDKTGKSWDVPSVLTSGDHAKIDRWRHEQSEKITQDRRPDLWERVKETKK